MGANNGALGEYLVYILWCIMGSEVFLGKKSPKENTFFLREYFVANFLF
jgi:hypothetical protein